MKPKTLLQERGGRLKVLALTAIRSEYDLLYPLLDALRRDRRFDVSVAVAGAHLTPLHGYSVRHIEADDLRIAARIKTPLSNDPAGRVDAAGVLLRGLGKVIAKAKPDLFMFLGDREEPLIGAIAAGYQSVPSVHIAGGDNAQPSGGDIDEEARHATTKLSHVHLTLTEEHTRRVLKLGEEPWRVKTVGNPGLDRLRLEPPLSAAALARRVHPAAAGDFILLIFHAMSSAVGAAEREMALCLEACLETGLDVFVGAPNSDPGHADILRALARYKKHPKVHAYRNLPRAEFTGLLRRAKAIVGNSSLGLLEASYIGLPCVNVGERQLGRLAGVNVQFVPAERRATRAALKKALFDAAYRAKVRRGKSPYGDGHMVEKAVRFLAALPPRAELLAKHITY